MILLDTHAVIWTLSGTRIHAHAKRAIREAQARRQIGISAISAWEIGMLAGKGRIELPVSATDYVRDLLARGDVIEFPVTAAIGTRAAALSPSFHGDRVDRLLVATAIEHDVAIVTRDARILRLAAAGAGFSAIEC